jgi:hypothetical protein
MQLLANLELYEEWHVLKTKAYYIHWNIRKKNLTPKGPANGKKHYSSIRSLKGKGKGKGKVVPVLN